MPSVIDAIGCVQRVATEIEVSAEQRFLEASEAHGNIVDNRDELEAKFGVTPANLEHAKHIGSMMVHGGVAVIAMQVSRLLHGQFLETEYRPEADH